MAIIGLAIIGAWNSPKAMTAEFCAVTNFGASGPCFATRDMCLSWSQGTGGSCIVSNTTKAGQYGSSSDVTIAAGLVSLIGILAAEDRREKDAQATRAKAVVAEREQMETLRMAREETDRREAHERAKRQEALNRLPEFGDTCIDIGFKIGTNSYVDCVIELYRRARR